jgi:hypothetical protein
MMAASFGTLGRIWSAFLRDLNRRGLKGVKLVISDAHEGLKAAITRGLGATWQRCRVGAVEEPVWLRLKRLPGLWCLRND